MIVGGIDNIKQCIKLQPLQYLSDNARLRKLDLLDVGHAIT